MQIKKKVVVKKLGMYNKLCNEKTRNTCRLSGNNEVLRNFDTVKPFGLFA